MHISKVEVVILPLVNSLFSFALPWRPRALVRIWPARIAANFAKLCCVPEQSFGLERNGRRDFKILKLHISSRHDCSLKLIVNSW
jgi:hypothetical protein